MATAAEQTFIRAIAAAEATRQISKASAFATWNYSPGGQATYIAAVATADNVYFTAVNAAMLTAGIGTNVGQGGPVGGGWATIFS